MESSMKNSQITLSAAKQTEKERKITRKTILFIAQSRQQQKLEVFFVCVWSERRGGNTIFPRKLRKWKIRGSRIVGLAQVFSLMTYKLKDRGFLCYLHQKLYTPSLCFCFSGSLCSSFIFTAFFLFDHDRPM